MQQIKAAQIKAENPGIAVTDLTCMAGEMWKTVTDRCVWEAKAAKAKEAYEKSMKEYKASEASCSKPKTSPKPSKEKATKSQSIDQVPW